MASQVKVEGARELEATMHRAADDVGDLSSAASQSGSQVAQVARGLAPVRSGRLVGTIRAAQPTSARAVTAGGVTAGGPGVPYAGPIHWGWAARNIQAQPFLTDALAQTESSVVNTYAEAVGRTVSTIHGK